MSILKIQIQYNLYFYYVSIGNKNNLNKQIFYKILTCKSILIFDTMFHIYNIIKNILNIEHSCFFYLKGAI